MRKSSFNGGKPIFLHCSDCNEPIPTHAFPVVNKVRLGICKTCHEQGMERGQEIIDKRRRLENELNLSRIYDDFDHVRDLK